jgi:GT2 family glycosyltransferase
MSAPFRNAVPATDAIPGLTVGIATRNRPDSLLRCLTSLTVIDDLIRDVIVVDDSSDPPIGDLLQRAPESVRSKLQFVEQPGARGPIVARNRMVQMAACDDVMLLDDDAYVIDAAAVRRALDVLRGHDKVGAVAFAQAEADGQPWHRAMQPAPVSYACYVPAYIGFAHFVKRQIFLELGGYAEALHFYGEEKDYCLRLLDAGYRVVYLPDALVAHVPDQSGRSPARYLRYVVRNDCLSALFNEPLPMALVTVPLRLRRYQTMSRKGGVADPDGLPWIRRELAAALPKLWSRRRPVRWSSILEWRRLRRTLPALEQAAG